MDYPAKKQSREERKERRLQHILQRLLDNPGMSINIQNYTLTLPQATAVLKEITDMLDLMAIPYQERHGTHELCILSDEQLKKLEDMKKNGTFSQRYGYSQW